MLLCLGTDRKRSAMKRARKKHRLIAPWENSCHLAREAAAHPVPVPQVVVLPLFLFSFYHVFFQGFVSFPVFILSCFFRAYTTCLISLSMLVPLSPLLPLTVVIPLSNKHLSKINLNAKLGDNPTGNLSGLGASFCQLTSVEIDF